MEVNEIFQLNHFQRAFLSNIYFGGLAWERACKSPGWCQVILRLNLVRLKSKAQNLKIIK